MAILSSLKTVLSAIGPKALGKEFLTDTALSKITEKPQEKKKSLTDLKVAPALGTVAKASVAELPPAEFSVTIEETPIDIAEIRKALPEDATTNDFLAYIGHGLTEQADGINNLEAGLEDYEQYLRKRDLKKDRQREEDSLEAKDVARKVGDGSATGMSNADRLGLISAILGTAGLGLWTGWQMLSDRIDGLESTVSKLGQAVIDSADEVGRGITARFLGKKLNLAGDKLGKKFNLQNEKARNLEKRIKRGRVNKVKSYLGDEDAVMQQRTKKNAKVIARMKAFHQTLVKTMGPWAKKLSEWIKKIGNGTMEIFGKRIPKSMLAKMKGLGKNVARKVALLAALVEMFSFGARTAFADFTTDAGVAEWHRGNKEQLNSILGGIGVPVLLSFLGTLFGTPIMGAVGLVVGAIWGQDMWDLFALDQVVNAVYDYAILGDEQAGSKLVDKFVTYAKNEMWDDLKEGATETANETAKGISGIFQSLDRALGTQIPIEGVNVPAVSQVVAETDKMAAEFIANEEDVDKASYEEYQDSYGRTAIGFGHNITEEEWDRGTIDVPEAESIDLTDRPIIITKKQAQALLQKDIPRYKKIAVKAVGKKRWGQLEAPARTALISQAYNAGSAGIKHLVNLGLNEAIDNQDIGQFSDIISRGFVKSEGRVLSGLVKRRQSEANFALQSNIMASPTIEPQRPTSISSQQSDKGDLNPDLNFGTHDTFATPA